MTFIVWQAWDTHNTSDLNDHVMHVVHHTFCSLTMGKGIDTWNIKQGNKR